MSRITHTAIPKQISDFIRDEYPRFVDFIQTYYKFLDTAVSSSLLSSIKDIDETSDQFIANYRKEFAIDIPKFDFLNDRSFIKFSRELYQAKGSEDALRFLFRAAFGSEIQISYPKDNILRASDGRWYKEWFFDVDVVSNSGYSPDIPLTYYLTVGSAFQIDILKSIVLQRSPSGDATKIRFYVLREPKDLYAGLHIKQTNANKDILFYGIIVPTVSAVSIPVPGSGWKLGQAISIPGNQYNTFGRVSKVGDIGELLGIDVIEYGFDHTQEPLSHYISSWFDTPNELTDPINYALWLSQRSTAILQLRDYGSNKGTWLSDDGHISNQLFRLQDNFFYQNYSYVVSTKENSNQATGAIIKVNHPAGLKVFKQVELTTDLIFSTHIDRSRSLETLYLTDSLESPIDQFFWIMGKYTEDEFISNESPPALTWNRIVDVIDESLSSDSMGSLLWNRSRQQSDNLTVTITDASNINTITNTYAEADVIESNYSGTEYSITLS